MLLMGSAKSNIPQSMVDNRTGGGQDGLSLRYPHTERIMNGALPDLLTEPPTIDILLKKYDGLKF